MTEKFLSEHDAVDFALQTARADLEANRGFLADLWDGARYTGVQVPLQAVGQIVDQVAGTQKQKDWTFMEAPKRHDSFAFQLGGAVGMLPTFLAANYAVGKGSAALFGKAESIGLMSTRRLVAEAAVTGALYEGVLMPSLEGEGFLSGRLKNAMRGGATFGTLALGAKGLHDFTGLRSLTTSESLGTRFMGNTVSGALAGFPAGMVSAQADSLLRQGHFASKVDTINAGRGFAAIGGVLGGMHTFMPAGKPRARVESSTEAPLAESRGPERGPNGSDISETVRSVEQPLDAVARSSGGDPVYNATFRAKEPGVARAQIELFRRGQRTAEFDVIAESGQIGRLLVQHEGPISSTQLSRADWIAMCNTPEVLGHLLASRGFLGRDVYLTENEGAIRLSTEKSPNSIRLATMSRSELMAELSNEGVTPDAVPGWLKKFEIQRKLGAGNNAVVFEVAPREGTRFGVKGAEPPEVVLKIIKQGDVPNESYHPQTYDSLGRPSRQGDVMWEGSDGSTWFLESRVDFSDQSGRYDLEMQLRDRGEYISDPNGSGSPVGVDVNTREFVLSDRDAVSKLDSGADQVLQATLPEEQRMAYEEMAENAPEVMEQQVVDGDVIFGAKRSLDGLKLSPEQMQRAQAAFPGRNAVRELKKVIDDVTNGLSDSVEDLAIQQQWIRQVAADRAQALAQIRLGQEVARQLGLTVHARN